DGYLVDDYQGPATGHGKLFVVTKPSGATLRYVHTLVPGEKYNNSFVALSPGGQWMVGGEWETTPHLQIYPTPYLNRRTPRQGGPLKLAGLLKLDHEAYDVQGCDFTSPTVLICSSTGNPAMFTNPLPLLQITLKKPLDGRTVTGHVVDLGSIPEQAGCTGKFEAEGVDFDTATGVLRVEENQPGSCALHTEIYEYKMDRH
ncbi:MAG TPA: hypothetical protein VHW47_10385, partial [Acidimicrobiales bacterium]|nr:hypothetical protein [Acidimicrobiales bacterium]